MIMKFLLRNNAVFLDAFLTDVQASDSDALLFIIDKICHSQRRLQKFFSGFKRTEHQESGKGFIEVLYSRIGAKDIQDPTGIEFRSKLNLQIILPELFFYSPVLSRTFQELNYSFYIKFPKVLSKPLSSCQVHIDNNEACRESFGILSRKTS